MRTNKNQGEGQP